MTRLIPTLRAALFCGAAALCFIPGQAAAQSLEGALSEAYASNPTLQAARAALRATDERVPQAKDGWRPTIELLGDLGGERDRQNFGTRKDTFINYGASLRITQELYDGGETENTLAAAEAEIQAERARLVGTEQDVLIAVVDAYMDVVQNQAVLDLTSQNELRLRRQLEATSDRFEVGEVTRTDVAQAESRVARANSDVIQAGADLEVSKAAYEEAVGALPGTLTTPQPTLSLPSSREESIALAVERNPNVLAAVWDRRSALRDVRTAYADLLPTVQVIGEASRDRNKANSDSLSNQLSITANLTVPIYQQGAQQSQVREAKQLAAQSLRLIEVARRSALEEATAAWENHQSALSTIEAVNEEVRATEIALEGVEQEASVGARTVLDVLDAEQEVLDARVSLVRAERDELVARYELLASVGALTAGDLALPVALYDETRYYESIKGKLWGIGGAVEKSSDDDGYSPHTPYFGE